MKIEKNKPLPKHTKLDYYECYALLTLRELFPNKYRDLRLKDKPDLQGTIIGIEVTIADNQNHQEALNNWVKACSCEDKTMKSCYRERMNRLGVKFTEGVQSWPGCSPTFKFVREAVEKRLLSFAMGLTKSS